MEPGSRRAAGSGSPVRRNTLREYLERGVEENRTSCHLNLFKEKNDVAPGLFCACAFVIYRRSVLTMWQGDTGSIHYSLGQLVVVTLQGHSGSFQGVPDLLAALEGRRRVPELVPLAPQLALCHRIVALPLGTVFLQRLVPSCDGREKQGKISRVSEKV